VRNRWFAGQESGGKDRGAEKKRGEYAAYLSALEKSGESQVSLTDPDSRAMAAHTRAKRRVERLHVRMFR
jgi:hypothetical protein